MECKQKLRFIFSLFLYLFVVVVAVAVVIVHILQWQTNSALDLLKKESVSAAVFAPGWIYETEQGPDFQTAQNR